MFPTVPSSSHDMTLDEVVTRLSRQPPVQGILAIGSTVRQADLSAASDYDLVLVLSELPVPLHVALTYIDKRLTDIIFVKTSTVQEILNLDRPVDADDWLGRTILWIQEGEILFDRSGHLADAHRKVQAGQWIREASDTDLYSTWFSINYNVRQNRRMLAAADPTYGHALRVRLLYCLADLFFAYFRFRRLLWRGEKQAVRYLSTHDPAYLTTFEACLAETDLGHKTKLYEQLAELTTEPLGGLWADRSTAVQFEGGTVLDMQTIGRGPKFWEALLTKGGEHD